MNFFGVLGAMALGAMLLVVPGCGSDDEKTNGPATSSTQQPEGSSDSQSGSSGHSSGSGSTHTGGSTSSGSESSSGSYGFCLGSSGWTCPSSAAKSACIKGDCAKCSKDPSQCSDNGGGGGGNDDNGDENGNGGSDE